MNKNNTQKHDSCKCANCGSGNLVVRKQLRRTNGPRVTGRRMSYGYYLMVHMCLDCTHVWEGDKIE